MRKLPYQHKESSTKFHIKVRKPHFKLRKALFKKGLERIVKAKMSENFFKKIILLKTFDNYNLVY